jgi:hypothetical protein
MFEALLFSSCVNRLSLHSARACRFGFAMLHTNSSILNVGAQSVLVATSVDLEIQALAEADVPPIDTDILPQGLGSSHLTSQKQLVFKKNDFHRNVLMMMEKYRKWRSSINNVWLRPVFKRFANALVLSIGQLIAKPPLG